ncbi:indole-3-glycerol phosphate synthase TrpC [Methylocella silvestris]|uniref:indole-3-glycerol-phosphate synthase n=1 Tax=Methylocella silvestris TaxID=199596 RepID=A0A2J7TGH6_METSI|nr:indole-3-glycerol-phosphate synthase [Methylocella silvestris]PNG25856.1 indole-3-glycerol phosphate synthase [Methylocella silvestris]
MTDLQNYSAVGPRLKPLLEQRQADVDKAKAKRSGGSLTGAIGEAAKTAGFRAALFHHFATTGRPGVIADIQGASPLTKVTRSRLDVRDLAEDFRDAGAVCISAAQDRRLYRGSLADFTAAKVANLPILANDLVVDQYQIIEARYAGADAIVLIVGVLGRQLGDFLARADSVLLDCLVDVRNEAELEIALEAGANLIGVNNRDLETMEVDPSICERLIPQIPLDRVLAVAAGGLTSFEDIDRMKDLGAKAVRIAGALMAAPDPYEMLHKLLGTTPPEDLEEG